MNRFHFGTEHPKNIYLAGGAPLKMVGTCVRPMDAKLGLDNALSEEWNALLMMAADIINANTAIKL